MTISVGWDNDEQTVLCYQFNGTWTWEDMEVALETGFSLTESVTHKVHVVADMRHSGELPHGLILKINKVLMVAPANRGNIVLVGANSEMKTIVRMAGRIHARVAQKISTANSFDDAYAVLRMKPNPARAMDISSLRETAEAEPVRRTSRSFAPSFAGVAAMFR